jgi:hypothetical protein
VVCVVGWVFVFVFFFFFFFFFFCFFLFFFFFCPDFLRRYDRRFRATHAVCPLSTAVPSGAVGLSVIRIRPPFFKTECSCCAAHKKELCSTEKAKKQKTKTALL